MVDKLLYLGLVVCVLWIVALVMSGTDCQAYACMAR